jgi:hypothetical protein
LRQIGIVFDDQNSHGMPRVNGPWDARSYQGRAECFRSMKASSPSLHLRFIFAPPILHPALLALTKPAPIMLAAMWRRIPDYVNRGRTADYSKVTMVDRISWVRPQRRKSP